MEQLVTDSRFAVYLIPPFPLSQQVAEIHLLLQKQFGFQAAGRFPVHCTMKGFFKKDDSKLEVIQGQLDALFQGERAILAAAEGYRQDEIGFGLSLMTLEGNTNKPLIELRERIVDVVKPFIAPDCDFREHDLGRPFHPHITYAFRDCPERYYDQVLSWLEDGPELDAPFLADRYHFLEFFSEDWDGPWWETISWRLIQGWRLTP